MEAQAAARIAEAGWVKDAWSEKLEGLVLVSLGFQEFWSNVAMALWPLSNPAGALQRAAERLAPRPMCVQVVAMATPETERAAATRGLSPREAFSCMARPAAGLPVRPPLGYGIEVVSGEAALRDYVGAQSEGFGDDLAMNRARHPLRMLDDERIRLLVARDPQGRAVATARVFIDEGAVGVSGVTTLPAHRGRGIASALVSEAVRLGTAAGADLAWLGAGDDVASLYERLGFERVAELKMFV